MNAVQDRASLDEKSVQKIARGEHKTPRPRRTRGKSKNSRVVPVVIDERIKAYLLERKTDMRCVQIITPTEVIVHNNRRWVA